MRLDVLHWVALAMALSASPTIALAEPLNPDHAIPSADQKTPFGTEPLFKTVTAGGIAITLEDTTLADIEKAFGGKILDAGDAGDSSYWLCYTGTSSAGPSVFWFVADGEMGGSDHALGTVAVEPLAKGHTAEGCAAAPASLTSIELDIPGVGAKTDDVTAKLGSAKPNKSGHFQYASSFPDAKLKDFTVTQSVVYSETGGTITGVAVSQSTVN